MIWWLEQVTLLKERHRIVTGKYAGDDLRRFFHETGKGAGSMATQIQGRASVLESEIKQDAGKGNTEKKEEELAELRKGTVCDSSTDVYTCRCK